MVTDNIHQHNHIMTPACCSTATVHATLWSKNGYFWYQTNYHDSNWNPTDVVPKCGVETQWMMSVLTSVFKTVVWTKQKNECWLFSGSSRGEERDEGDVGCRQRVHQSRNCKLAELTGHRARPVSALYTPTHKLEGRCICHMSDDTNLILHFILENTECQNWNLIQRCWIMANSMKWMDMTNHFTSR